VGPPEVDAFLWSWLRDKTRYDGLCGSERHMPKDATGKKNWQPQQTAAPAAARGNIAAASEEEAELESLRRTRRLLMEQIAQMDASMGQLTDSDAVIAALTTGIEGCDGEMGRGKKMLRRISQLDSADDRVVAVAWCVFFATLAYVWGQRIFGLF
jgi:hypothetical protein